MHLFLFQSLYLWCIQVFHKINVKCFTPNDIIRSLHHQDTMVVQYSVISVPHVNSDLISNIKKYLASKHWYAVKRANHTGQFILVFLCFFDNGLFLNGSNFNWLYSPGNRLICKDIVQVFSREEERSPGWF